MWWALAANYRYFERGGQVTRWTQEQDDYLRAHWQEQSDKELAAAVGHPLASTGARRGKLGLCKRKGCRGKDWTQKELDYIAEVWGEKTIPQIARHLGRSINAVKIKANRLGYAGQMKYGEMMTARKVSELLGVDVHAVCDYWIPKCGLKGRKKRIGESGRCTIIKFADLLEWLEANQDKWDSRRVELYGLGMEYDWLKEKRKADALIPVRKAQKWTPEEDDRLRAMFRRGDMTYAEIGAVLGRSKTAVGHRLTRTDIWGTAEKKRDPERFQRMALYIRLITALRFQVNALGYEPYWQKAMCQHWSDAKGCTAGCADCDSCTQFQRIRPQYCRRCGGEFLEREGSTFCPRCRTMRKKQAQRKWAVLRKRKGA